MATPDASGTLAVVLVVSTLLVTGPLVDLGGVPTEPTTARIGDGNATVTAVEFDADRLRIDRGRFGSGVAYLRIPELSVDLADVRGNPRLVYTVYVPELGFKRVATKLLATDGVSGVTVDMPDRAYDPASLEEGSYRATVSLRVQSFTVDSVVFSRNTTVAVVTND